LSDFNFNPNGWKNTDPELESLKSLAIHQASMAVYLSSSLAEKVGDVLSDAYGDNACVVVALQSLAAGPENCLDHD
jgi:precorrin-4 methylase